MQWKPRDGEIRFSSASNAFISCAKVDSFVKSLLQATLGILGKKHLGYSALKNANCLIRRRGEF